MNPKKTVKKKEEIRENPVVDPSESEVEIRDEGSLRPKYLKEVIGRSSECRALKILIDAARNRKESVDHILFYGPPGLGKTTFAHVVANEMASQIKITSGPAITRQGDLAAILTNLREGDVLFIDEIHRLGRSVEEVLYPAMEDYELNIVIGKGPSARSIRLQIPHFTLIGATTRVSLLSSPLRDRFGFVQRLDYFNDDEIAKIIDRASEILAVSLDEGSSAEIARRSRGTARIALRLLRRVRDFGQVQHGSSNITEDISKEALDEIGIDNLGLDDLDRKILKAIAEKFGGGPVGLSTIAASVSEDVDTISDVYEPFLLQKGLLKRTPRGRVTTKMAYNHLGLEIPPSIQESLV